MSLQRVNAYPPQLVIDLALGVDGTEDVLRSYNMTMVDYENLLANPAFRAQLVEARKLVLKEGLSFRTKAKILAEQHLETMHVLMEDDLTPPATKLGIFQALVRGGDLEPRPSKESAGSGATFNLQIVL